MQKFLALAFLALMATPPAFALTITGNDYTATNEVAFQWDELTAGYNSPIAGATRILGNDDDTAAGPIALGFSFGVFSGYTGIGAHRTMPSDSFNQVYVTSNGLLTVGRYDRMSFTTATTTASANQPLNTDTFYAPMIAAAWDDWTTTPSGTDGVYYATLGNAGSRRFVVEWRQTAHYGSGNPSTVTFQVALFEGSNTMEFRYLDMNTGNSSNTAGASATAGWRDYGADRNGWLMQWSYNQGVLADNTMFRLTPISDAVSSSEVPEPASLVLALAGLGLMAIRRGSAGFRKSRAPAA